MSSKWQTLQRATQADQIKLLPRSKNMELRELSPAMIAITEFVEADRFILRMVLSDGAAQEGLCVCITSHLLGHNVETEPLHYLALHGCPLSCAFSALSPLAQEGRKCGKVDDEVCGGHSRGLSQLEDLTYICHIFSKK